MNKILLSFDVEEFDVPREHGEEMSVAEGVAVSSVGLERILELLAREKVVATFFCTGNFASTNQELVRRIWKEGHEVGCHGVDHFRPAESDFEESKKIVEKVVRGGSGKGVKDFFAVGYRAPRMQKVNYARLVELGFLYDSSVNPTVIPGRYNNFGVPRKKYRVKELTEIPTSVAGAVRFPLFWLALHWLPVSVYIWLCKRCLRETGYLAVYFHPWEFGEIAEVPGVPSLIRHKSGEEMAKRLEKMIEAMKKEGEFVKYKDFL